MPCADRGRGLKTHVPVGTCVVAPTGADPVTSRFSGEGVVPRFAHGGAFRDFRCRGFRSVGLRSSTHDEGGCRGALSVEDSKSVLVVCGAVSG